MDFLVLSELRDCYSIRWTGPHTHLGESWCPQGPSQPPAKGFKAQRSEADVTTHVAYPLDSHEHPQVSLHLAWLPAGLWLHGSCVCEGLTAQLRAEMPSKNTRRRAGHGDTPCVSCW